MSQNRSSNKTTATSSFAATSSLHDKEHPVHRWFLLLRLMALAGGVLWALSQVDPAHALPLLLLMAGFVLYSSVLTAVFQWSAVGSDTVYRIALLCDAVFIFVLVELSGERGYVFLLAYSLLVGLHAYYSGFRTGLALAGACSILLTVHSLLGKVVDEPLELLFVAGFLILLGGSIGWLADHQRSQGEAMSGMIDELRKTGRALSQAERINMLGRLTANIAHEFNNPISAILTRLECMIQDARDEDRDEAAVADLHVLYRQSRKLAEISGKLLRFARAESPVPEWIDINASIERAVEWIEHRLPEKELLLNLNLSSHLPRVKGQPSDIEEAIVNLLGNAIESCTRGGQIYLISALSGGRERAIQIFVVDTGGGIAPEHADEIFDPFFTTKAVGVGTGLGLFITHEIVRRHHGTIEVETELGKGTTFVITLPLQSQ